MGLPQIAYSLAMILLVLLVQLASGEIDRYIEDTDRFPGWKGELPSRVINEATRAWSTLSQQSKGEVREVGFGQNGKIFWRGGVIPVSWKPRAFLFKRFLNDTECQHIINKAKPHMAKSTVVDDETGQALDSTVRTSTGTFFAREEDPIIAAVEKRVALVSHLPVENGEGMQVLQYKNGQKYEPHHDYFHDKINRAPANGGQRIATVLMYLTTVEEGGETVFPQAKTKVTGPEWSECAKQGLGIKSKKGDALLFFSLNPDGSEDPSSLHGSCATTKGEKWSATKWIHVSGFRTSAVTPVPVQRAK